MLTYREQIAAPTVLTVLMEVLLEEVTVSLFQVSFANYGNTGFQRRYTKLERFLAKIQHTQRKLLNFELWINSKLPKSAKI